MRYLPITFRHWRLNVLSVTVSLLLLLGLCGYAAEESSLYSFVPLDSPAAVSLDLPALWQATADFRKDENISGGLQMMEQGLGLSVENDLLSWAGQAAFTVTDIQENGPGFALLLQVRNADRMMDRDRLFSLIQKFLPTEDKTKWIDMDYRGIAIRRTEIAQGRSVLKLAVINQDGWVVIAVGEGVIRKIIDAHTGNSPSIEKHPLFTKAVGGLPTGPMVQFCINGQGIMTQMEKSGMPVKETVNPESSKFLCAGAVSFTNDLLFDSIYCTASDKVQATLKQLDADTGKITGDSLAQLPEGAFATIIMPNPDKWFAAGEQMALDSVSDADMKASMKQGMSELDDVRAVLKRFAGELAISGAWKDGKGFGVTLAGQTGADADATAAAAAINSLLQKMHAPVKKGPNYYSIPDTQGDDKMFATLLCWTARKQWVLGASHPDWLAKQAATPALKLPEFAIGANMAGVGNFSFLPAVFKAMGADQSSMEMLNTMKAGLGDWAYAVKIDEDGSAVRTHVAGGMPMLATMGAVLFPVFAKAREKARTTQSISNLRQLAIMVQMNAQDNDETLPVLKTAADIKKIAQGMGDQILISPRTNEAYVPNPAISGKALGSIANPSTMIVIYEKTPDSDGSRCAAFLDGHIELIQASRWAAVKKQSKIP